MAAFGLPVSLLPFAIALELGGGVLLILGWQTRIAALALAGFCVITALAFHTNFADRNETIHFQKDLALAGALLFMAARGAGAWSVDAWRKKGNDGIQAAV